MSMSGHLFIHSRRIHAGGEWVAEGDAWWFVSVSSGTGYWMGPDHRHSVSPGNMLIVPGGFPGSLIASRFEDLDCRVFCFRPEAIVGVFSIEERVHLSRSSRAAATVVCMGPEEPHARYYRELSDGSRGSVQGVHSVELLQFAVRVLAQRSPEVEAATGNGLGNRLRYLLKQIPDSRLVEWPTAELARSCNCTPRHFRRVFKEVFGQSVNEKQTEIRFQKASQMLRESDATVAVIARACGYRHPSLLRRQFEEHFKVKVEEWRMRQSLSSSPPTPPQPKTASSPTHPTTRRPRASQIHAKTAPDAP